MKVCRTPGCPTLIPSDAYKGRCPACNRQAGRDRGTRAEQGYGADHRALRKAWQRRMDDGEPVSCWRCQRPIVVGTTWHLGHDDEDRTVYRGPECAACNLEAAGRNTPRG